MLAQRQQGAWKFFCDFVGAAGGHDGGAARQVLMRFAVAAAKTVP